MLITAIVIVVAAAAALIAVARRKPRKPVSEESSYQRGLSAAIAGDREEALKQFTAAVREDPNNVDAYVKLGDLLRETGQAKRAAQIHRELMVKRRLPERTRSEIQRSLARDLVKAEQWNDAIETARSLPRAQRNTPLVLALMRDAYENTRVWDKALQTHRDLIRSAPKTEEPSLGAYRAHLASLILKSGDRTKAKSEFLAAVKADHNCILAYRYLGDITNEEGDTERAIAYWMKLITDRPDRAHLVFDRLEKGYFELGDFGRMLGIYEDVVAKAPSDVWALCGMSRMLERKGEIDEAIRFAREAVKHEGTTLAGHKRLLEVLMRDGRHEQAAEAADGLVSRLSAPAGTMSCPTCGRGQEAPVWRCPHCRAWIDQP